MFPSRAETLETLLHSLPLSLLSAMLVWIKQKTSKQIIVLGSRCLCKWTALVQEVVEWSDHTLTHLRKPNQVSSPSGAHSLHLNIGSLDNILTWVFFLIITKFPLPSTTNFH